MYEGIWCGWWVGNVFDVAENVKSEQVFFSAAFHSLLTFLEFEIFGFFNNQTHLS